MSRHLSTRRILFSQHTEVGKRGRNHAGTANGIKKSANDHAVILRIQGRRHPALATDQKIYGGVEPAHRVDWTRVHLQKRQQHEDYLPPSADNQSRFQVEPQADPAVAAAAAPRVLSRDATRFEIR